MRQQRAHQPAEQTASGITPSPSSCRPVAVAHTGAADETVAGEEVAHTTVGRKTAAGEEAAGGGAAGVRKNDHHRNHSLVEEEDGNSHYFVEIPNVHLHHGHVVAPTRLGEYPREQASRTTSWAMKS